MNTPVTTVGCAIALAALAMLMIGRSGETVPLPRPRPPPPDTLTPSDRAVEFRWPKPVETVRFVQATNTVSSDPRATGEETPRENRKAVAATSPPRVAATSEGPRRHVKRERRERDYAYDICRGRGRVYTDSGRSWRCRR